MSDEKLGTAEEERVADEAVEITDVLASGDPYEAQALLTRLTAEQS